MSKSISNLIKILEQDIKLNDDQPLTTKKLKRILEVVIENKSE